MTLQIALNHNQKKLLLKMIDNEGFLIREQKNMCGFFEFSKKNKLENEISILGLLYRNVLVCMGDDGDLYFPTMDEITMLQAIAHITIERVSSGTSIIKPSESEDYIVIVEQILQKNRWM